MVVGVPAQKPGRHTVVNSSQLAAQTLLRACPDTARFPLSCCQVDLRYFKILENMFNPFQPFPGQVEMLEVGVIWLMLSLLLLCVAL